VTHLSNVDVWKGTCQKNIVMLIKILPVHLYDMTVVLCVVFMLRPTVSRPVRPGIGLPFGAHYQILSFPFFSDNCFVVLPVGRPL
jgi:hypothetical protein